MVFGIGLAGVIASSMDPINVFFIMCMVLVSSGIAGWAANMTIEMREAKGGEG